MSKLLVIAGPCQLESLEMGKEAVDFLKQFMGYYPVDFVFKTSFDKANRTSGDSPRGVGRQKFLKFAKYVKSIDVRLLTDVHEISDTGCVGQSVDVLQIPAMLSRQTDLIRAASMNCEIVNIKKGQFMSPHDMKHAAKKADYAKEIWLTERGTTFGYNNLVVDFRSFQIMKQENPDAKIIFDSTHSTQLPGGGGSVSSGQRCFSLPLAKAAIATGSVDGIFLETHINPDKALSDGPNMIPWRDLPEFMDGVMDVWS